jgi:hypothetical protein
VEGGYTLKNDVWKSTFSMTNKAKVAKACKITYPVCQATGLSCWPTSTPVKRDSKGQVTCQTLTNYCNKQEESSTGWWEPSSTGTQTSSDGVSAGMIALIVVLILAGTGAVLGYLYYARRNSVNANLAPSNVGTEGLLGPLHTDSAALASTSDYYSQPQEGAHSQTQAL